MTQVNNPFDFSNFKNLVGLFGNIFAISFLISPAILLLKIHKRQQDPLKTPYFMMVMNIINCVCWFSYGFLINDFFIQLANGIGFSLNTIYLCIYFFYRLKRNFLKSMMSIIPTVIIPIGLFFLLVFLIKSQDFSRYSAMIFNVFMYGAPGHRIVF